VNPEVPDLPWDRVGAVMVVIAVLMILWSRPMFRYGMIGAGILAALIFLSRQGGA
jgi:hypothetical protein